MQKDCIVNAITLFEERQLYKPLPLFMQIEIREKLISWTSIELPDVLRELFTQDFIFL